MTFSAPAEPAAHILIVDDNPDQLRLLLETLRNADFRFSVAFDGLQGYDRAVASLPDLILLDVRMPRMDGFALCRRLKANPATAAIPVIFLSAASDIDERLIGLRDGGVDYIIKPFDPEEVIARVRIHLGLVVRETLSPPAPVHPLSDDEVLVKATQQRLLAFLSHTPRLDELAEQMGVNEKRLSRAFRQCLDMTVFEYLRDQRMRAAQRLLAQTPLSVVAISEEVGFASAANFSTAFREHTGLSPSGFRRASQTPPQATPFEAVPDHG